MKLLQLIKDIPAMLQKLIPWGKTNKAIRFTLASTAVLFLTGLASIPWASQFSVVTQDFIYALGRLPILYVLYKVFEEKEL